MISCRFPTATILLYSVFLLLYPFISQAATVAPPRDFRGLVSIITNIISTLIIVIFALTFLAFVWGIIKGWIIQGGDPEGVESGKKVVVAGIVAFVVMCSLWGILYLLQNSLFGR